MINCFSKRVLLWRTTIKLITLKPKIINATQKNKTVPWATESKLSFWASPNPLCQLLSVANMLQIMFAATWKPARPAYGWIQPGSRKAGQGVGGFNRGRMGHLWMEEVGQVEDGTSYCSIGQFLIPCPTTVTLTAQIFHPHNCKCKSEQLHKAGWYTTWSKRNKIPLQWIVPQPSLTLQWVQCR